MLSERIYDVCLFHRFISNLYSDIRNLSLYGARFVYTIGQRNQSESLCPLSKVEIKILRAILTQMAVFSFSFASGSLTS